MLPRRLALIAVLATLVLPLPAATAAPRSRVRLPPAAGVFDYQLGGAYPPAAAVRIVDRDRHDSPARGRYSICYVNAFQTQPEERRWWLRRHPGLLLRVRGRLVPDPGWPGEYLLDTGTAAKRAALARIVGGWIAGCARKGFQAVEPDNLDSWTRAGVHRALTGADNLAYARLLVRRAHALGLAVAQKNAVEVSSVGHRSVGFDFAIAEECSVYGECAGYTRVYGRHVLEVEYTDTPLAAFTRACARRGGRISIIRRDRDVVPRGAAGYYYRYC